MIITPSMTFPAPQSATYNAVGSYTYTIPPWCSHVDVIAIGGGGGGNGGGQNNGNPSGGAGGSWQSFTITRGANIPWSTTSLFATVGNGGGGAGVGGIGGTGGASTVVADGSAVVTAAGGGGGAAGTRIGLSPGDYILGSQTYVGGTGGAVAPGSGGNGAVNIFSVGSSGARGQVWFYAYTKASVAPEAWVTYDATGTGGTVTVSSNSAGITGTHTCTGNAVIVAVSGYTGGGTLACTVTYGGQAMTQLGATAAGTQRTFLFGLLNPPLGLQTVSGTVTGATILAAAMTSVSYAGVVSFGTTSTATGTSVSPSQTVSSSSGRMVAHAFGTYLNSATISGYSQVQRATTGVGSVPKVYQGDAAGVTSLIFSATLSSSVVWGSVAVELMN